MKIDLMVGSSRWADTATLAREVEAAGLSGMVFTETGQTPWLSIAAAATAAPSLTYSTGIAVAFGMSPMVAASLPSLRKVHLHSCGQGRTVRYQCR